MAKKEKFPLLNRVILIFTALFISVFLFLAIEYSLSKKTYVKYGILVEKAERLHPQRFSPGLFVFLTFKLDDGKLILMSGSVKDRNRKIGERARIYCIQTNWTKRLVYDSYKFINPIEGSLER